MENINRSYSNSTNIAVLGTVNPSEMGQIFSYNGNNVRMRKMNGYILVCLTDFAKPFPDKNLSHIVNSRELTDYVARMSEIQNCISTDLLRVTKGGDATQQGTWAHHRVAIRVAQKLSTDFAIWVDDKIEELLTTGSTSIQPQYNVPQSFSEALQLAADQAKQIEEQQKEIEQKDAKIIKLQPKANFAEAAFKSEGKVDIGQAAKILGLPFGRTTLFKKLREAGVFFANRNEPKQKYIDAGYFEMTLLPPIHRDNHPDILYQKVLCNPKGLAYINHLFGGIPSDGKLAKIR